MFFTTAKDKQKKLQATKARRAYYWRNRVHILEVVRQYKIRKQLRDFAMPDQ